MWIDVFDLALENWRWYYLSGFVYSSAVRQTEGGAKAPSARSRHNHQDQRWRDSLWPGRDLEENTGTWSSSTMNEFWIGILWLISLTLQRQRPLTDKRNSGLLIPHLHRRGLQLHGEDPLQVPQDQLWATIFQGEVTQTVFARVCDIKSFSCSKGNEKNVCPACLPPPPPVVLSVTQCLCSRCCWTVAHADINNNKPLAWVFGPLRHSWAIIVSQKHRRMSGTRDYTL